MAKLSIKVRQLKRQKMVVAYAERRAKLKKEKNYLALDKLPRDSSSVRLHNRCKITGRAKGYIRKFGVSRLMFRDLALAGKIPGITKASW